VDGRRRSRGRGVRSLVVRVGSVFLWQVLSAALSRRALRVVVIVVLVVRVFVVAIWLRCQNSRRATPSCEIVVCM
jgi:hypothetical protein